MTTQYTCLQAAEATREFAVALSPLRTECLIQACGFGMRPNTSSLCFIVQVDVRTLDIATQLIQRRFQNRVDGFSLSVEAERIVNASYLGDRVRRTLSVRPRLAWPGWPGSAVRAEGLERAGTLGCYVRPLDSDEMMAMTCEHVLCANGNRPHDGTRVSTYVTHRDRSDRPLGTIVGHELTAFDCILIRCFRSGTNVIPRIGRIDADAFSLAQVKLGAQVAKYGAASDYTTGYISSVQQIWRPDRNESIITPEVTPLFNDTHRLTKDVHRFTSFCSHGDSGSVVVLQDPLYPLAAIGLLVARGSLLDRGYMLGLQESLAKLGVKLA